MKIRVESRGGFAAVFLLILLAIMTVYLVSNAAFLRSLKWQIQKVEQEQIERHGPAGPVTEKENGGTTEKPEDNAD